MQIQANTILNKRYRLTERIGSGGFSVVWRAIDEQQSQMPVAIKMFMPDKGLDADLIDMFRDEFELTSHLDDNRLVKMTDYFVHNESPCLAMPFMPKKSLYHKLRKLETLPEREIARVLYQVSGALSYLHNQENPVLHLDIKPENILIDYSDNYLLSDFGISIKMRETLLRASNTKGGTFAYSPPELNDSRKLGAPADIFALGVMLYELSAGMLPWSGMGGNAVVIGMPLPELPQNYSRRLQEIVHACLNRYPINRPLAGQLEEAARIFLDRDYWEPLPMPHIPLSQHENQSTGNAANLQKAIDAGELEQFLKQHPGKNPDAIGQQLFYEFNKRYGQIPRNEFDEALRQAAEAMPPPKSRDTRPFPPHKIPGQGQPDQPPPKPGKTRKALLLLTAVIVIALGVWFITGTQRHKQIAEQQRQDSIAFALKEQQIADSVATVRADSVAKVREAESRAAIMEAERQAWQTALNANTIAAYDGYLRDYPTGENAARARERKAQLEEQSRFASYTETTAGLNLRMVAVKGGAFTMGCTAEQGSDCYDNEKPTRRVTVGDYYIGKFEVTNAQFCKFLNEKGNQTEGGVEWIELSGTYDDEKCRVYKSGSTFYVESGYDNYPVIFASWYGVKAFCNWISVKTGKNYQLPSEAQWEFAARSRGKAFKYAWGSGTPTRSNGGNIADETAKKKYSSWTIWEGYTDGYIYTSPVGIFGTNELGIYDMSGNVWEWCEDDWHGNYNGAPTDGRAWVDSPRGSYRVLRGGGWDGYAQYCRVSYRFNFAPGNRGNDGGFRLACFP